MSIAQRLLGAHGHEHDGSGGHVVRPRSYEFATGLFFLGRRRRTYSRIVELAGIQPGDRVLDIGCGTGFLSRRAAKATGPGGAVVGVDPSEPVVAYARRVSPSWCAYQVTTGDAVDEPDAGFDVALSSLAIHHIPPAQRAATFSEIHRLVRPGGRVVIAEFRPPRSAPGRHAVGMVMGNAMRHSPIQDLPDLIGAAGFTVTGSGELWPLLSYVTATRS